MRDVASTAFAMDSPLPHTTLNNPISVKMSELSKKEQNEENKIEDETESNENRQTEMDGINGNGHENASASAYASDTDEEEDEEILEEMKRSKSMKVAQPKVSINIPKAADTYVIPIDKTIPREPNHKAIIEISFESPFPKASFLK